MAYMYLHGTIDYIEDGPGKYRYICRIRMPRMWVTKTGRSRMEALAEALKFLRLPLESD